ncbi:flavodoxin [Levilactobacillus zymae]|uniref:flavodoxin n=1 Tax=Levilactobacillus zymae TaxID=267363 RepID=UPI0028BA0578|nr:flavodoxin [Levilactobacillus zymae]MDT6980615.1 flavodoxin [Levilactobacillus zymae]
MTNKTLIMYYSWSGTTKRTAQAIANAVAADVVELTVPSQTFPSDMFATSDIAKDQLRTGALPPLTNTLPDFKPYATILIGGPVWSAMVATPVRHLLTDLATYTGTVAPFYTDAGTAGQYEQDFASLVNQATVKPGLEFHGQSADQLAAWVRTVTG